MKNPNFQDLELSALKYLGDHKDEVKSKLRTRNRLMEALEVNQNQFNRLMWRLEGLGLVKVFQVGPTHVWIITPEGEKELRAKK